ncbi:hypothetical protein J2795_002950 [Chryseobacterium bernardetii]|jgi:hypothetical protein|uniref:YD repeat-containing protein n=2 Tax=Chryseobacterium TaxID=59732 RepID=A0A543EC75_9FLAO|nr:MULTISPECIES: hypothetical protein [Chryseobacterium]MDR6371263.1 hypothetical protein [Chryseobacterium vietnamense]MDR6442232.1 hypothetical protein [Chryseobacterium bernardetii]MDR6487936.1 hypothetical protein [Chryseobacterium vietnamense]TQM19109.1 hypothetical protein FB551_3504 [Chryseobacterium aquifrigidense]
MKKLMLSSLALAVLSGCVSNDNPADHRDNSNNSHNNNNGPFHLLKKATDVNPGGQSYVVEFKYNGDQIIETYNASDDDRVVYTYSGYNSDYIAKTEEFIGGALVLRREFTYSNGRLSTEKITDQEQGTLIYTKYYQYISDTHVQFNEYKSGTYNPSTGTYSDLVFAQVDVNLTNAGNVASAKYTYNGVTYNITNTYDTFNNPMKNIRGFVKINLFDVSDGQTGYNNLLNQTESYSGSSNGTNKITAVYTLNGDNYPTKAVTTYDISGNGTSTHNWLYEYY